VDNVRGALELNGFEIGEIEWPKAMRSWEYFQCRFECALRDAVASARCRWRPPSAYESATL